MKWLVVLVSIWTAVAAAGPLAGSAEAGDAAGAVALTTESVAAGLSSALYAVSPPEDFERLFVLEQNTARVRLIKNGSLLATPFLDIDALASSGGERGLLGLAFHPDYRNNGYFFVNYTANSGATVVARYTRSANPDLADPASAKTILTIGQPFSNHNGGCIQFGPDGYLYIGMGDGGSGNDPQNNGQRGNTLLGKMLRIDIDTVGAYQVPPTNPFVGNPGFLDEIWSVGQRNPWRWSFDRETGDMYIGDVGQSAREEVSFEPAGTGGRNYGWRCMEGSRCTGLSGCTCNGPSLSLPIWEYINGGANCAITGGYNYRGCAIPEIDGTYFFGDYCSGNLWSFQYDGMTLSNFQSRNAELGGSIGFGLTSFGEDAFGEIYIVEFGEVHKIVRAPGDIDFGTTQLMVEVSPGETLFYEVNATNTTGGDILVEGWVDGFDRDGNPLPFRSNPAFGPKTKRVRAGATFDKTLRLRIPADADPGGPYILRASIGDFDSGTLTGTGCVGFHIVP